MKFEKKALSHIHVLRLVHTDKHVFLKAMPAMPAMPKKMATIANQGRLKTWTANNFEILATIAQLRT